MESSWRDVLIDMVVERFIFKKILKKYLLPLFRLHTQNGSGTTLQQEIVFFYYEDPSFYSNWIKKKLLLR